MCRIIFFFYLEVYNYEKCVIWVVGYVRLHQASNTKTKVEGFIIFHVKKSLINTSRQTIMDINKYFIRWNFESLG